MACEDNWHTDPALFRSLPGGDTIIDWFGYVPSFHDAELVDLQIAPGTVAIRLHAFRMANETDTDGYFLLDRHAIVTLRLKGVTALRLNGNGASIVSELRLRRAGATPGASDAWPTCGGPEEGDHEIVIDASYGLCGSIFAKEVELVLEPLPQG